VCAVLCVLYVTVRERVQEEEREGRGAARPLLFGIKTITYKCHNAN
jgi:hypothetical protein